MENLSDLLSEVEPVGDHLAEIYGRLPDTTLAEEQGRLRERFLDIAGKLVAISQIRRTENELTLFD